MTGVTAMLADYLTSGEAKRIQPEVTETVTDLFIDTVGVMFLGSRQPCATVARGVMTAQGGAAQAVIVGTNYRSSMANAALLNGTAAHALDLDDTQHPAIAHPSAVLIPTILAAGEARRTDGNKLIAAYVYGLDVFAALGNALNPSHYDRGWHATATLGTLAAAAASAILLTLTPAQTGASLAIAASQSAGLRRNFGSMTKPLHAGLAAQRGLLSAIFAEAGITAGEDVFEGEGGFFELFSDASMPFKERIAEVLNHQFALAIEGLAIKQFPSCGVTHPPIEAALQLRDRGVDYQNIEKLELTVNPRVPKIAPFAEPVNGLQAKFSLTYPVAVAIVKGRVSVPEFANSALSDSRVAELARKICIRTDPNIGLEHKMSWGCRLAVTLTGGRKEEVEVKLAKGKLSGERLSRMELETKFYACMSAANVPTEAAQECLGGILKLSDLNDVRPLTETLLRAGSHNGTQHEMEQAAR